MKSEQFCALRAVCWCAVLLENEFNKQPAIAIKERQFSDSL